MYVEHGSDVGRDAVAAVLDVARTLDLAPGPGGSRITPIPLDRLPLLVGLPIALHRAAVVALYPSAQLVGHTDPPVPNERYHVPLDMNEGCWVFSDGVWQQLAVGHVYQMDPTKVHGAVNWGASVRLHLMLDTA